MLQPKALLRQVASVANHLTLGQRFPWNQIPILKNNNLIDALRHLQNIWYWQRNISKDKGSKEMPPKIIDITNNHL